MGLKITQSIAKAMVKWFESPDAKIGRAQLGFS
jgi:hypothetical protein